MKLFPAKCHEQELAGNIAKTMTSNGKQFTVTREMLTAFASDRWNLSAVFKFSWPIAYPINGVPLYDVIQFFSFCPKLPRIQVGLY